MKLLFWRKKTDWYMVAINLAQLLIQARLYPSQGYFISKNIATEQTLQEFEMLVKRYTK